MEAQRTMYSKMTLKCTELSYLFENLDVSLPNVSSKLKINKLSGRAKNQIRESEHLLLVAQHANYSTSLSGSQKFYLAAAAHKTVFFQAVDFCH